MTPPDPDLLPLDRVLPLVAAAAGDDAWLSATASLVAGGKSNLTFQLACAAGRLVLRRPPAGELLATAHDMAREVRVQRALGGSAVPVPRIVLDDDGSAFGVPFYVMSLVEGDVVRDGLPPWLADDLETRHRLGLGLVDTLADLHAVDPEAVGLGDFGRPAGFLERQVRRWGRQWEASRTEQVEEVDRLAGLLHDLLPESPAPTVVHGDFRLDNCVVGPGERPVRGVLDWEMSTLGDPLTDVGMLLFYWVEPGEPPSPLSPAGTAYDGFPRRAEVVERYAARTGRDLGHLWFYLAFAHLKFAVITQGIRVRVDSGAMAGQDFGDLRDEVRRVAAAGLAVVDEHVRHAG
ncbi:MAG: phosphotransferase [Frankiales bacterium]|nr:phosphotransferase [Frankiales bacterium]